MNDVADSVFWIWFQLIFGIGTRRAELLSSYFESPKLIYDGVAEKNRVLGMLTPEELNASEAAMERAKEIKRRTISKGVDIITPDSGEYPALLRQIYSKPAVLYVKGDMGCLSGKLAIAMVGSRKHTEYGRDAASLVAKGLAAGGAVVVSGLAHGIDTECHMAALTAGGKSIGVLGCGIDVDYPKGNAKVKRLMCENGAVITEFPLGTEPKPGNFPIRNRVVSGMCHGVVVVEADSESGSLLTAQHALDQGRDIFAIPGSIFSVRSKGPHRLIREGATPIDSARDIFDEYEYLGFKRNIPGKRGGAKAGEIGHGVRKPMKDDAKENPVAQEAETAVMPKKRALPDGISDETARVYSVIGETGATVEQISEAAETDVPTVLSALTELEIYGLIQGYPGRRFGIIPEAGS